MIKGSIQEEDIRIINIYAPNIGAPHYVRQILTNMKGEIHNNTILVGDFNIPLTPMDRSTKQEISKERNFKWYNGPVKPNWYLQHFTPKQWISPFSQVHTEPSAGLIKLMKTKHKEQVLKAAREKQLNRKLTRKHKL